MCPRDRFRQMWREIRKAEALEGKGVEKPLWIIVLAQDVNEMKTVRLDGEMGGEGGELLFK